MLTAALTGNAPKRSDLRLYSGAKGTRTPDPHTASVVRYQLRHSPKKLCCSKLHHQQQRFKVAGHATSPQARGPRASTGVGDATRLTAISQRLSHEALHFLRPAPELA
jgi:hypothetical protein